MELDNGLTNLRYIFLDRSAAVRRDPGVEVNTTGNHEPSGNPKP